VAEAQVAVADLRTTITDLLVLRGVPRADATVVADVSIDADLDGRASHGVARIPTFVHKLEQGGIVPDGSPTLVHDHGAIFVLDGRDGFGQVALHLAMTLSLERSRQYGIAYGAVRNTNNPGMLGSYGRMAAERGQIAILGCNAAPAMPPPGGAAPSLGTNPLCIALPASRGAPPLLDMATSAASKGAIRAAGRRGDEIPVGWAVDGDGAPTTDPTAAFEGMLLPAGGIKGAGLALMIELLSGLLADGSVGDEVRALHDPGPSRASAFVITIDPAAFGSTQRFDERLLERLAAVHAIAPARGATEVLVPGDRSWRSRQQHLATGVPIPDALWAELQDLAAAAPA
jgi:LDH2 family malate/lactate/ureidoglycolate dehydrogenase